MAAHITGVELAHQMSEVDLVNGVANRWWWFAVERVRELPFGGTPSGLDVLAARLSPIVEAARKVTWINLTPKALSLWEGSMYHELGIVPVGRLGEILSRAAPHVLRMAGIFCLADGKQAIEPIHLEAAKALWDASVRCSQYVFGDNLGNPQAEKILAALKDVFPAGLTRAEISNQVFGRHETSEAIKAALAVLLEAAKIREVKEPTAGRQAHRYFLRAN
jgi:hypothetical protein